MITIIGAGLAGLSCAKHLTSPYQLFEAEQEVGGVARSYYYDTPAGRFTHDFTGHWLHLKDPQIKALVFSLFADDFFVQIERRAQIHIYGQRTPYPFQANTHGLPPQVIYDCVTGFVKAAMLRGPKSTVNGSVTQPPKNFGEFIVAQMGDGIAQHFMLPYNKKIWTLDPFLMSHQWCQRFVPLPTLEEVIGGAVGFSAEGLGYNSQFLYPKNGGMGQLAIALNDSLSTPAQCDTSVTSVDWQNKQLILSTGKNVSYSRLVNTIPLDCFFRLLQNNNNLSLGEDVVSALARLQSVDVTYWDIGLAGENGPTDPHWLYFPEAKYCFYRVGQPSAALSHLAPKGHRFLSVEVSRRHGTICEITDSQVMTDLKAAGLMGQNETPLYCKRHTIPRAYVLMDAFYGEAREFLLGWLKERDIDSIGRYGGWTYDSMEGAMIQGRTLAAAL